MKRDQKQRKRGEKVTVIDEKTGKELIEEQINWEQQNLAESRFDEKLDHATKKINSLSNRINELQDYVKHLNGVIEGLKVAIQCVCAPRGEAHGRF